jgi:hypothetical protein
MGGCELRLFFREEGEEIFAVSGEKGEETFAF